MVTPVPQDHILKRITPSPPGLHDFMLDVARGLIPGHVAINKFGRNPDADKASATTAVIHGRDIWDLGIAGATVWVPPAAARIHQLASSDDEDGGAGTDTGALTIEVFGLGPDFTLQDEIVTLNGTTDAPTSKTYTMIYRMVCLTFGSAGRNLGNIDATADTDNTVTARVSINNNQTLMAIFQIPANTKGYMQNWRSEIHKAGGGATFADMFLMSKKFGGGWRVRDTGAVATDGRNGFVNEFKPPKIFQAKEYIKVIGNPSKDGQDIGGGFDLICVSD